ncbi:MAG TPA: M1 family metallopeptidase [Wenzhouxiangella sp.]|nr:M1 family metallopeptidase [Wenzhouxiangella sp.]
MKKTTRIRLLAAGLLAVLLSGCGTDSVTGRQEMTADGGDAIEVGTDPHSHAEFEKVRIHHMRLDLTADMDRHTLAGHVILDLERPDPAHNRLVLDTRHLDIEDVTAVEAGGDFIPLSWRLGTSRGTLGRPLVIVLPEDVTRVRVDYASQPEAYGLQWLEDEQTSSGKPFMFSQSEPHYARTWVPLQDTPAVRYTFDAKIRVPADLMAVMGAAGNETVRNDSGVYEFHMPQAIPSYLMAIAVGDLEFARTGARTGVYAEPGWIERAASEFHQLEKLVEIGENLYGPYRWERYDLLVLPPSFPFGGMENPRLSFITPTVIAGDGSLLDLIAHELAHSWSGNLVTNAAWRDIWLNEGFTTYFESRIMERHYGERVAGMLAVLDWQRLTAEVEAAKNDDATRLVLDENMEDPEGAFSGIPYAKGRFFLEWVADRVGRADFDRFLRSYFDHFAFQSISTETFRDYLQTQLVNEHADRLSMEQVDEWLYEPGLPDFAVAPQSDAFVRVDQWRQRWLDDEIQAADLPNDEWSVYEWLHFLKSTQGKLDTDRMQALDEAFDLTASGNYEILFVWLMHAVENRYEPAVPRLEEFLLEVGRNKYTFPLYSALAASDWGHEWATEVYRRARSGYHSLTRTASERALGLESGG